MGTRCTITFADHDGEYTIYRHWDEYPGGVIPDLQAAMEGEKTWALPRFEADEAAAGFIATHKTGSGNYRLSTGPDAHRDIEWHYRLTQEPGGKRPLILQVFEVTGINRHTGKHLMRKHVSGPLHHLARDHA